MPTIVPDMDKLDALLVRAEQVLARVEHWLPPTPPVLNWQQSLAARWRKRGTQRYLQAVEHIAPLSFVDLQHVASQKTQLLRNTKQFVAGKPANHVLLTGARGTGKSSLIKACLTEFAERNLRLIEVDKNDLADLPDIVEQIANRPEWFIVFCDDLSFEAGDAGYKALKVALDGSIAAPSSNMLIYATSNRRHLLPEQMADNEGYRHLIDGDLHPSETVEEKISLSERFGLWLSFYPFKQDDYLDIVAHWLQHYGCQPADMEAVRADALRWALQRGSRSGRVANQFARDLAGQWRGDA